MTIEELEQIIKEARWSKRYRARRKTGLLYAYAQKRVKGKLIEKYIAPVSELEHITKEQVLDKLVINKK